MLKHLSHGGTIMENSSIGTALVVLIFTFSISYSTPVNAHNPQSSTQSNIEIFELSGLPSISTDILEYEYNEAKGHLAQGKCSDLKPDYCGMGACKDGWKCQANVSQCMCFPPN